MTHQHQSAEPPPGDRRTSSASSASSASPNADLTLRRPKRRLPPYTFKPLDEAAWAALIAASVVLLQALNSADPLAIAAAPQAWAFGLAVAAVRAALGAFLAVMTRRASRHAQQELQRQIAAANRRAEARARTVRPSSQEQ